MKTMCERCFNIEECYEYIDRGWETLPLIILCEDCAKDWGYWEEEND